MALWVLIPAVAAGAPTITHPAAIAAATGRFGQAAVGEEPVKQLVVMLRGILGEQSFNGAGVIVGRTPDRLYIATAHHVVRQGTQQAERIEAQFRWLPGEWKTVSVLDNADLDLDLAVLAVDARGFSIPDLPWGALADPKALTPGSRVFPVGFPNAMPWFRPQQPHVVNTVTAQQVRTEGQVFPGNSGGALVTEDWRLVGLVSNVSAVLAGSSRIDLIVEKLKEWRYPVALTVPATPTPTPPPPEAEAKRTEPARTDPRPDPARPDPARPGPAPPDDCIAIRPGTVQAEHHEGRGGWHVVADGQVLLPDFEANEDGARTVALILRKYNVSQYCQIGRPPVAFYFLSRGAPVLTGARGRGGAVDVAENCRAFNPATLAIGEPDQTSRAAWSIHDSGRVVLRTPDSGLARRTLAIIGRYGFTSVCLPGRPMYYLR
jgi:hypothetical protein